MTDTDNTWRDQALCAQVGGDLFFPGWHDSTTPVKRICAECPVAAQCLTYALNNEPDFGIFAGLTARERRQLKRVAA